MRWQENGLKHQRLENYPQAVDIWQNHLFIHGFPLLPREDLNLEPSG